MRIHSPSLLFGCFFQSRYFRVVTVIFGIFLSISIIAMSDMDTRVLQLKDGAPTVQATIVDVGLTNVTADGLPVIENVYTFKHPAEEYVDITWRSYSKGDKGLNIGDTVKVEYLAEDPYVNRIVGFSDSKYGKGRIFDSLYLPLFVLLFMLRGLKKGFGRVVILVRGEPVLGRLIATAPTGWEVMGKKVFKLTYAFTMADGTVAEGTVKTRKIEKITDDEEELLVYDRKKPANVLLVDSLNKRASKFVRKQMARK